MPVFLPRICTSVVLFFVMFFSIRFLGFDKHIAVMVGSVPLILGVLNIFSRLAFGLSAILFVVVAFSALLPAKTSGFQELGERVFDKLSAGRVEAVVNGNRKALNK